jgi:hypothetical protein
MPYFIYKIRPIKQLELVEKFDSYRDAKQQAKSIRENLTVADNALVKIMFGKNQTEAELLLKEEREPRPQGDD